RGAGAATSSRGRTRARQGPRRDPQRVVRRRHPLRVPSGPAAAAARARRAAAATGGALGLSTARRAAVLAVVVCALALTVAVPLRNYVTQRHEIAAVAAEQERLARDVGTLTDERSALRDPAHIEALARERLGYARPGEVPYRVELPGDADAPRDPRDAGAGAELPPAEADLPWYARVARTTLGTAP
ncbi:septum formation initiator family protein, partial [Actinomycetospora chibensis]